MSPCLLQTCWHFRKHTHTFLFPILKRTLQWYTFFSWWLTISVTCAHPNLVLYVFTHIWMILFIKTLTRWGGRLVTTMVSFLHNISPGTQTYTQVQKRSQTSLPFCIPLPVWIFNMENNISASSYLPFMMTCCVSVLLAFSPSLPRSLSLSLHFTTCTNNIWHFAWSPRMWWLRPNDSAISPPPTTAATFLIDTDELCQRLQDSSVNKNFIFLSMW